MKAFWKMVLLSLLVNYNYLQAQVVDFNSTKKRISVEEVNTIKFGQKKLELNNVQFKSVKILFTKNVEEIKIRGRVTIVCTDIELDANTKPIKITGRGILNIEFKGEFKDNNRTFAVEMGNKAKIIFNKTLPQSNNP